MIASKTTHCVLGSANQKVCATTGGDGESQTAALAEEQLVLVRRRHLPRHPLKRIQAAVTELVVLLVRIIWGLVGGTSEKPHSTTGQLQNTEGLPYNSAYLISILELTRYEIMATGTMRMC